MYHYRLYCTDVLSDIELIQVPKGSGTPENPETAITIQAGKYPEDHIPEKLCFSEIGEKESFLTNYTCLLYVADGKTITYESRPDVDQKYLPNYILGWGMAMLFQQRHQAVIHCSALYNDSGAFLISGRSGSGKSTMTSMLLEKGFSFMADDTSAAILGEDGAFATPCYPYRKLCRDVVTSQSLNMDDLIYIDEDKDKFLVPYEENFPTTPKKIKALFFLEPVEAKVPGTFIEVEAIEVTGLNKLGYIRRALFLYPLLKKKNADQELFKLCLDLAGKIPIYAITRPTDRDSRTDVFNKIVELTEQL